MKLKQKVIATCALIVLIPLLLGLVSGAVIILRQFDKMTEEYNVGEQGINIIQNPMIAYNSVVTDRVNGINAVFEENPGALNDLEYLGKMNRELEKYSTSIFVAKNGEYTYLGDSELFEEIKDYIPEYGKDVSGHQNVLINLEDTSVVLGQLDYSHNEDEFSVYLALDIDSFLPEVRNGATQLVLAIIIILIFVACFTLAWLHKLLISPLTGLSKATKEITEGNLDFSLKTSRRDEIGELQNDFDNMRIHLKESMNEQLKNAEAAKEMMSNISHDLKTPLTAIKGYAEGLMDGIADTPEKRERYYKTIYSKACIMEELVEDLTYFSKLDNKTITYDFHLVSLKGFIEDCIEEIEMDVEMRNIRFEKSYSCENDTKVIIDSNEIKRVFLNIVGNSIKYMDKEEGVISIHVSNDEDFVWITVEDNGQGVDEKEITKIFERFYRGDTSRGTKKGGTGLGLAIAKSIVEAHGGTISANSMKGVGTSIRFSLPCEKAKEVSNE